MINSQMRCKRLLKKGTSTASTYILLTVTALICAGPFLWLLSTSFKSNENVYALNFWPQNFSLESYIGVFQLLDVGRMLVNSCIIAGGGVLLNVLMAALCAYPLAKIDFYGKKIVNGALMATMIIPATVGLVVNYITIQNLHLNGNFWGVILPNSVNVFSIILLRQAYLAVPKELLEAARIDGAGELRTFLSVVCPIIKPGFGALAIFTFINTWNDYFLQLIMLRSRSKLTIALGIATLQAEFATNYGLLMAGAALGAVPIVTVFLCFQKYFTQGITMGAVKG